MEKILIVEDNEDMQGLLLDILTNEGYLTQAVGSAEDAQEVLKKLLPDLIILDLKLPGKSGLEFLENLRQKNKETLVVIITAHGDVKSAVEAMKLGAYDFLTKPFENVDLLLVIQKALAVRKMLHEIKVLKKKAYGPGDEVFFSESREMKKVVEQVNIVAPTNMTVIVQGESGSGKELVAHLIHQKSPRAGKPFVPIDCGAIPETLVESELFGYEKGAFTGAESHKAGQFEKANGGTLFLDEITNLSDVMQKKFLRVLEERRLQRLGGKEDIDFDVRVIVATNVNIAEAVRADKFREDLYHRLNEFLLVIPPLREHKEEIPFFVKHFIEEANLEFDKKVRDISSEAIKVLFDYSWPGNVRELRNVVRKAVLLADTGSIYPAHLTLDAEEKIATGMEPAAFSQADNFGGVMEEFEKELIKKALERTGGNKSKAAELLKMSRETLYRKIKEYGMS